MPSSFSCSFMNGIAFINSPLFCHRRPIPMAVIVREDVQRLPVASPVDAACAEMRCHQQEMAHAPK